MRLPGPPLRQLHLAPGELCVTAEAAWVSTLLGSCVAVTMFSHRARLAAICHGMLPHPPRNDSGLDADPQRYRFLSCVIPEMARRFRMAGIEPGEIEVKMFGGANVIELGGDAHRMKWIGTGNVTAARLLLRYSHLIIRSENVGGTRGSKILFNTQTGEVLHKHLDCREAARGRK